ncbi:hypothetical protein [Azospirillum griseum]|nr:hypothetical protein [Azospirillum griseum]
MAMMMMGAERGWIGRWGGGAALCVALALYGAYSVPAPPAIRAAEAAIGVLLLLAAGWRAPLFAVTGHALRRPDLPLWEALALPALAWLLWVPLLRGVGLGWDGADVARDVIPLLFLFAPVALVPALRGCGPWAVRGLGAGLILAGLLFTLRWWKDAHWGFGAVGLRAMSDGGVYYLNAPSVLFAAVALPTLALAALARGGLWRWLAAPLCALGGALCLAALAGAVHRSALGLAALSGVAVALWWGWRSPWLWPLLVGVALLAVGVAGEALVGAWGQAAEKTRLTGVNARWDEAAAVVSHIAESPWSLLFGDGWGARMENPAVGGWRVSYTHTLATYALLKGGALGVLALAAYLGGLAPVLWRRLRDDPPLGWAVLPPLAMALGAHTSFKYLDTGLLLTLLLLSDEKRRGLSDP